MRFITFCCYRLKFISPINIYTGACEIIRLKRKVYYVLISVCLQVKYHILNPKRKSVQMLSTSSRKKENWNEFVKHINLGTADSRQWYSSVNDVRWTKQIIYSAQQASSKSKANYALRWKETTNNLIIWQQLNSIGWKRCLSGFTVWRINVPKVNDWTGLPTHKTQNIDT